MTCHRQIYISTLVLLLGISLVTSDFKIAEGAEVTPDGTTNTTLDAAPNGVPVVNIAQPNSDGVSRNTYSDYNVDTQGLILNNANDFGVSQLGGALTPNPNLNGVSGANVILNEVTSTNISHLTGYTETFGRRAELVLANPNGITCNGCGFINTSRATFITGSEVTPNGPLGTFTLGPGQVSFTGTGLNGDNVDAIDVISRAVQIQAQLQARQRLTVQTGNDLYDAASNTVSSDGTIGSGFAIDASLLGSMYAGQIELITTEAGVGVRSAAEMIAQDAVDINSAGTVDTVLVQAGNTLTIRAATELVQQGDYLAGSLIDLNANILTLAHRIESDQDMRIEQRSGDWVNNAAITGGSGTTTLINNNGTLTLANSLFASGNITIDSQSLVNQNRLAAQGALTLNSSGDITNQAGNLMFSGSSLALNTDGTFNNSGDLYSKGTLLAKGLTGDAMIGFINQGGRIESVGDMTIAAISVINTHNFPTDDAPDNVDQTDLATILVPTVVDNGVQNWIEEINPSTLRGLIQSGANLTINADTMRNHLADIYAGGDLNINANKIENTAYVLREGVTEAYENWEVVGKKCKVFGRWNCKNIYGWVTRYRELIQDSSNSIQATMQSGGTLALNATDVIDNGITSTGISDPTGGLPDATVSDPLLSISLPGSNSFFIPNPSPDADHPYVIETDPALIDLGNLFGSNYFLDRIGYAHDEDTVLFLGDAWYDQRVISDQVRLLTGQRYLISEADDNLQYQQLADQAALERERLGLNLGELLTDAQIAELEHNILWYVETKYDGKTVLIPKLYLSQATRERVAEGKAATLMGEQVALNTENLMNEGMVVSDTGLIINASGDVHNKGGTLKANDNIDIATGGDFISETTWWESIAGGTIRNGVHEQAELIAGANANINSGGDIEFVAASLTADGAVNLNAGGDLNITAIEQTDRHNWTKDGWNYTETTTSHLISSINAQQLASVSQGNTYIEGAQVSTSGDTSLTAGGLLHISAVQNSHEKKGEHKKYGGLFSADKTTTSHEKQTSLQMASINSGSQLWLQSGAGTMVLASELISKGDMTLNSFAGDIMLVAGKSSDYQRKTHKSEGLIYVKSSDVGSYKEELVATKVNSGGNLFFNASHTAEQLAALGIDPVDLLKGDVIVTGSEITSTGNMQFGGVTLNDNSKTNDVSNNNGSPYVLAESDVARIENLRFDTLGLEDNNWNHQSKEMTGFGKVLYGAAAIGLAFVAPYFATGELLTTKALMYSAVFSSALPKIEINSKDIVDTKALYQKSTHVLAGGDFAIFARDGIYMIGADVKAQGKGNLNAGGDVNILAAVDQVDRYEEHEKASFNGMSFDWDGKRASIGVDGEYLKTTLSEQKFSHKATKLEFGDDLAIYSGHDVLIAGSEIATSGLLSMEAQNALSVYSVEDILDKAESITKASLRYSIGVGNSYYDVVLAARKYKEAQRARKAAVKALKDFEAEIKQMEKDVEKGLVTEEDVKLRKNDTKYYVAHVVFAATNEVNSAVSIFKSVNTAAKTAGTFGFYTDVAFEMKGSKTDKNSYKTTNVASKLTAGKDITLSSIDDLEVRGSDMLAGGDIRLASSKDVLVNASAQRENKNEDTKSVDFKVSVGTYGKSVGDTNWKAGAKTGFSRADAITWRGSDLQAGNDIWIESKDSIEINGSKIGAVNDIHLSATNDISIQASRNTKQSFSEKQSISLGYGGAYKKDKNGKVNKGKDGSTERVNKSWSVGFEQSKDNAIVATWENSQLAAGNLIETASGEDTEFLGADARAKKLVVKVGGDLNIHSKQGYTYANGYTAGLTLGASSSGVKAGKRNQERLWADDPTEIIGSESVNIVVNGKTSIAGALIANLDAENNDLGNFSLTTFEFEYQNLNDHDYKTNWGIDVSSSFFGIGKLGGGENKNKKKTTDKSKKNEKKKSNLIKGSTKLKLNNSGHVKSQIVHATVGYGDIEIVDGGVEDPFALNTSGSTYLANLNREYSEFTQTTANRKTGGLKVDATIDHRLFTKGGRNLIKKDAYDAYRHIKDIYEILSIIGTKEDAKLKHLFTHLSLKYDQRQTLAKLIKNALVRVGFNNAKATAAQIRLAMQMYINDIITRADVEGLKQLKAAGVIIYDGDPSKIGFDMSSVKFNKNLSGAGYNVRLDKIAINARALNITDTGSKVLAIGHDGYHALANKLNFGFSDDTEEHFADSFGNSARDVWMVYSKLGGYETNIDGDNYSNDKWLKDNANSKEIIEGNSWIKTTDSKDFKGLGEHSQKLCLTAALAKDCPVNLPDYLNKDQIKKIRQFKNSFVTAVRGVKSAKEAMVSQSWYKNILTKSGIKQGSSEWQKYSVPLRNLQNIRNFAAQLNFTRAKYIQNLALMNLDTFKAQMQAEGGVKSANNRYVSLALSNRINSTHGLILDGSDLEKQLMSFDGSDAAYENLRLALINGIRDNMLKTETFLQTVYETTLDKSAQNIIPKFKLGEKDWLIYGRKRLYNDSDVLALSLLPLNKVDSAILAMNKQSGSKVWNTIISLDPTGILVSTESIGKGLSKNQQIDFLTNTVVRAYQNRLISTHDYRKYMDLFYDLKKGNLKSVENGIGIPMIGGKANPRAMSALLTSSMSQNKNNSQQTTGNTDSLIFFTRKVPTRYIYNTLKSPNTQGGVQSYQQLSLYKVSDPKVVYGNTIKSYESGIPSLAQMQKSSGSVVGKSGTSTGSTSNVATGNTSGSKVTGNASMNATPCKCCFAAGTVVKTFDGLKPIEGIELGELVASRDDITGEIDWKPVTHLFRYDDERITYEIVLSDEHNNIEVLEVTDNHPFWIAGKGWIESGNLKPGMQVTSLGGETVSVLEIGTKYNSPVTYNIEVADFHTYFVGESAAWVHNQCPCEIFKTISSQGKQIFEGGLPSRRQFEQLRFGNLDPPNNFPVIDRINRTTKMGTSMKTIDLRAEYVSNPDKFRNEIRGYIETLRAFNGGVTRKSTELGKEVSVPVLKSRRLEIGVQADMLTDTQRRIIREEARRAANLKKNPVEVKVFELK